MHIEDVERSKSMLSRRWSSSINDAAWKKYAPLISERVLACSVLPYYPCMTTNQICEGQEIERSVQRRIDRLHPYIMTMLKCARATPSASTIQQYTAAWQRMQRRRILPEKIGANARRSYNLYRAALIYFVGARLMEAWKQFDQQYGTLTAKQAHEWLNEIERCLSLLKSYPPGDRDTPSRWRRPEQGSTRKGKRVGLSRLPAQWRHMIVSAAPPDHEYHNAMLISAITGLRPAELLKGVIVDAMDESVRITIRGAKITKSSGQPLRQLWLTNNSSMVRQLLSQMASTGSGRLIVSIDDPRNYCDYIRSLSRRLFPDVKYTVTPYSFRHQFSADHKAQGVAVATLARMLGHVSGKSQQRYGATRQGRAPVAPVKEVAASRPVHSISDADKPWLMDAGDQEQAEHLALPMRT